MLIFQLAASILSSNWMQRFKFGCNPDKTDITFLLPWPGGTMLLALHFCTSAGCKNRCASVKSRQDPQSIDSTRTRRLLAPGGAECSLASAYRDVYSTATHQPVGCHQLVARAGTMAPWHECTLALCAALSPPSRQNERQNDGAGARGRLR